MSTQSYAPDRQATSTPTSTSAPAQPAANPAVPSRPTVNPAVPTGPSANPAVPTAPSGAQAPGASAR